MSFINVNDIAISYELHSRDVEGDSDGAAVHRPLVVLINGLADTKETWAGQVPALLEAGYNVFTFDNRGVGASSRPHGRWTSDDMAKDLQGLVEALNLPTPFHLVGVSMGGMITQTYALVQPSHIKSLTLACTYAAPGPFCSRMFDYWADLSQKTSVATVMQDVLLWAFTPEFFDSEDQAQIQEADDVARNIDQSTEDYLSQLNVIQTFDSTKQLKQLADLDVLILAGEQDILIPVSLSKKLHDLISGSKWSTVRGGHACLWEFPGPFNTAIIQHIESVEEASQHRRD